jgi:hypothetical protein
MMLAKLTLQLPSSVQGTYQYMVVIIYWRSERLFKDQFVHLCQSAAVFITKPTTPGRIASEPYHIVQMTASFHVLVVVCPISTLLSYPLPLQSSTC